MSMEHEPLPLDAATTTGATRIARPAPASPVTVQPDAADRMLRMLHEIDDAAAPVTGPDVAKQTPTQFLMSQPWAHSRGLGYRYNMSGQELVDLLTDYATLIRTALEEQTRDATVRLLALQKEKGEEWAKTRKQAMQLESEQTRQLREALTRYGCHEMLCQSRAHPEAKCSCGFDSVLGKWSATRTAWNNWRRR